MEEHVKEFAQQTTILAALLTPGTGSAGLELSLNDDVLEIQTCIAGKQQTLRLSAG